MHQDCGGHARAQIGAPWTIARLVAALADYLRRRNIASARLDAEVLVAHGLGVDRVYLYTHADQPLTAHERAGLRELAKRRAAFEPIAYICGYKEFYSRRFEVSRDVLIPRPASEHVVEAVLAWAAGRHTRPWRVLDMGTGSGALAVTLAALLPAADVTATDLSPAALEIARRNAYAHDVAERVALLQGDLFAALPEYALPFDVVVSNPPYIGLDEAQSLMPDVRAWEPGLALFADVDGLGVLRRLCAEVFVHVADGGVFACEMGSQHSDAVRGMLAASPWASVSAAHDLAGHPRVMVARRRTR